MIRVSAEALTAYEKRTGFLGLGAFLVERGEIVVCNEESAPITHTGSFTDAQKSFVVEGV